MPLGSTRLSKFWTRVAATSLKKYWLSQM